MLNKFEHKIYSQNGEDGIIAFLLDCVGREHKYFVEFGVEDGQECNTRYLREYAGFNGLMMDGSHENRAIGLYQEIVTAENINELFQKYNVPTEFEILSIDIDSNDFWVWQAIAPIYRPKIVIIEYNAHIPPPIAATIPYNPHHYWDGTCFFGASLSAFNALATERGYTLVYCEQKGTNAFFIRNDLRYLFLRYFDLPTPEQAYVPANYGNRIYGSTQYQILGYTLFGHGRIDQTTRNFIEYPSLNPLVIPELDIINPIEA